jgi:hypothetical protein
MTVVYFETFEISFTERIDSCAVDGFTDFVCVFEEEGSEFAGDGTTDRWVQEPVLQGRRPNTLAH